jgi:hypothetical protein
VVGVDIAVLGLHRTACSGGVRHHRITVYDIVN